MNFFENKKILVTGGTGHLGAALIHYLVKEKNVSAANIRVFYLNNSPANSLNDIRGLEMIQGNVLNAHEVEAACQNIQLVFHMIGSTTFDSRQKKLQWQINVEGTRNILEAVRKSASVTKLCYISTVNVLSVPNSDGGIGNIENCNPYVNQSRLHSFKSIKETRSFAQQVYENKIQDWEKKIGIGYFDSKLAAQELVNEYAERYNMNVVSIMPGTMFGPYDYLIGNGLYILSLYQNKMPAVLDGGLPLTHVMDVAEGITLAIEKAKPGSHYIVTGQEVDNRSIKDMAAIIVDVLRQKFPNRKFKMPSVTIPKAIAYAGALASECYAKLLNQPMLLSREAIRAGANKSFYTYKNAQQDLGYKPKRTFREAVEEMIDYYSNQNLLDKTERFIDKR